MTSDRDISVMTQLMNDMCTKVCTWWPISNWSHIRWFVSQTSLQTQKSHKNLTAYGIQGSCHRLSKGFCILLVGKVQTIHLTVVSPLVKGRCGLVVFQSTYDCTVNDHLKQYKTIAIIDVQLKKMIFQYQKFCSNQNVLLWQYSK